MTPTANTALSHRSSRFHWLALSFCALGILMSAFFNLGAASADHAGDIADLFPMTVSVSD